MVPGSTLRYGSSFCMETEMPRDLRILPRLAVVIPLPTELTTPPVTKMNLGMDPAMHVVLKMLRGSLRGRQRTFVLRVARYRIGQTTGNAEARRRRDLNVRECLSRI